jgi:hypothetical protein
VARRWKAPLPPWRKKPNPSVSRPLALRSAQARGFSFFRSRQSVRHGAPCQDAVYPDERQLLRDLHN